MSEQEIPGLPARRAALQLLDAVLRQGKPLESALEAATQRVRIGPDRALAHAIASETLRRLHDLDALIDSSTRLQLADDAKARMVLRMALTQILAMGTPAHAAIATALPMVSGGPKRLVHGVLGSLLRKNVTLPDLPSLPFPVSERWRAAWGGAMIEAAQAELAAPGLIDITLKSYAETGIWAERLGGKSMMPGHIRLPVDVELTSLPGFEEGDWWVQNLSASMPARLLGEGQGRRVLDLCAAPGGKTMQLAAQGWQVTAVDSKSKRMDRLKKNLARTGLDAECVVADIAKWQPDEPFDAVLLDAPCTATGIFARHPDVLHRIGARDIEHMAAIQTQMFARASQWLKPEGQFIYSTCSLEPEEGEAIDIPANLKRDAIAAELCPPGTSPDDQGALRILPNHNMSGFYILLCTTS